MTGAVPAAGQLALANALQYWPRITAWREHYAYRTFDNAPPATPANYVTLLMGTSPINAQLPIPCRYCGAPEEMCCFNYSQNKNAPECMNLRAHSLTSLLSLLDNSTTPTPTAALQHLQLIVMWAEVQRFERYCPPRVTQHTAGDTRWQMVRCPADGCRAPQARPCSGEVPHFARRQAAEEYQVALQGCLR